MGTVDEKDLQREIQNLMQVVDSRFHSLEKQTSEQHGENKQALHMLTSQMATGQRQMSVLIGEGPLSGIIGTMQNDIKEVRSEVDSLRKGMLGLLAAFITTIVGAVLTFLLQKK